MSTLAHSSAKTPPARRALTLISFGRKPTLGPWRVTSTRRAVTLAGETPNHFPNICTDESTVTNRLATAHPERVLGSLNYEMIASLPLRDRRYCCVESRRPGMIATEKRKAKPISDDSTLTRINFCTDESTVTIYLISVDCQRNDDPPNQQFA